MGSPFEWLRSIARRGGDDTEFLLEAANGLASLARDPRQLVVASRRLLDHHRNNASLWWLTSHALASADAASALRQCHERLSEDTTSGRLRDALPILDADQRIAVVGWSDAIGTALDERFDVDVAAVIDEDDRHGRRAASTRATIVEPWELADGRTALVVIAADAASPSELLAIAATSDVLAELPTVTVWCVTSTGRLVPPAIFAAIAAACGHHEHVVVAMDRVDKVIGPRAIDTPGDLASRLDCPIATELLRPLPNA